MIFLFNNNLELLEDGIIKRKNVISNWQTKEINGLIPHTVEFKYSEVADKAEYFGVKDPDFRNKFWVYKITDREKTDNPNNGVYKLSGIHKFFDDLRGRGFVQDLRPNNSDFLEYMIKVFEGTGWTIGTSAVTRTVSGSLYYISKLDAFWKLIESANCEFEISMSYSDGVITEQRVDFADEISVDNGRLYVHGDKLLNVVASTSEEFIPTAFLPRGKGVETENGGYGRKLLIDSVNWSTDLGMPVNKPLGEVTIELKDRTALYGYADGTPRLQIVDFPDITDAEELAKAGYQYALDNARQKFQYKAKIFETGYIATGEKVRILSRKINAIYTVRIFKVKRNFLNPLMKEIELGDKIVQSRAEQAIQEKREEEKKGNEIVSMLINIRNELAQDWWNTDGHNYQLEAGNEYGLPGGIYSFNAPIDANPNELIAISAGKMVIAIKDESGVWQPLTGADGKGIYGDSLIANSVTLNKLGSDVGQGLDISSNKYLKLAVESQTKTYVDNNIDKLSGKSAYEIAVEKGFQGTEEEWLASIDGKDGYTPIKGVDYFDGEKGDPGKGIKTRLIYYKVTTENVAPSNTYNTGWTTTPPVPNEANPYLWAFEETTYTDNTSSKTAVVLFGMYSKPGENGNDGKTAYELAVEQGYQGTVEEWLKSLDGKDAAFKGTEPPTDTNLLWFDENTNKLKFFDGTEWREMDEELLNKIEEIEQVQITNATNIQLLSDSIDLTNKKITEGVLITEELSTTVSILNDRVNQEFERISSEVTANGEEVRKITGLIGSGMDEEGNVYTEWKSGENASVRVGTDKIQMISAGEETFKVENGNAHATSLYVQNEIGFGNHTAKKYGTEFTIFSWTGGNQ